MVLQRPAAPDFVKRVFTAEEPDLVWAGDMTEIVTEEGRLYLATVIDLFSRRLLGYPMGARHDADLVVAALNMAAATRGGDVRGGIFHSDRLNSPSTRPGSSPGPAAGWASPSPWAGSARASTTPSARRSTAY
ncbi:DDE-type integrase/transposase/recombinase [Streptomyces sp. NPDC002490]|uniref:DDE-type integrase/transposase/recombinase n=1 Tax=Streptomyces sp. NPDC002490 TaxID=3154416 RepID=UPI0033330831